MAGTLTCPTCNHKVKVDDDDEVDDARCPYCDEALEEVPIKLKPRGDHEEAAEEDDRPSRKKKKRPGGLRDNGTSQDSRAADRFDLAPASTTTNQLFACRLQGRHGRVDGRNSWPRNVSLAVSRCLHRKHRAVPTRFKWK